MKINWEMPASAMTAEEFLLVATIQGLCAALSYGAGVIIHPHEIAEDAMEIVAKTKALTKP